MPGHAGLSRRRLGGDGSLARRRVTERLTSSFLILTFLMALSEWLIKREAKVG